MVKSPDDGSFLRSALQLALGRLYDNLAYVRSTGTSSTAPSQVRLWDIHVPLRSNLSLDFEVEHEQLATVEVQQCGTASKPEKAKVETAPSSKNVNPRFLHLLFEATESILRGKAPTGLQLNPRPLIAAPIWADGKKHNSAAIEVTSALNAFRRVVLLGPPGSGKSTIAKAVACAHLGPDRTPPPNENPAGLGLWDEATKLPLFVELKEMVKAERFPEVGASATADTYLQYLSEDFCQKDDSIYRYLVQQLQEGQALLIFDGLDEVPVPHTVPDALQYRREQLGGMMRSICTRFPRCQVIVTSRPAGYSGWTLRDFAVTRVMPLNDTEAFEMVRALYRGFGLTNEEAKDKATRLARELRRVPRSLREQPLFVTLLAGLFADDESAELPAQRGALLNQSIELLLNVRSLSRTDGRSLTDVLGCDEDSLRSRLEVIAYKGIESGHVVASGTDGGIPRSLILDELFELGRQVNSAEVLEFMSQNAGLLVSPAPRRFRFAHRLFQEYLAAAWISRQDDLASAVVAKVGDDAATWQEVALLLADHLTSTRRNNDCWNLVQELVEARLPESLWIAARIYVEQRMDRLDGALASMVNESLRGELSRSFMVTEGLSIQQLADCGRALAVLSDPRLGVGLDRGEPELLWCALPGGRLQMGTDSRSLHRSLAAFGSRAWDFSREEPLHEIEVTPFEVSRYPVTVRQYQAFVEDERGFAADRWWTTEGLAWRNEAGPAPPGDATSANRPQTYVAWFEAHAFCRWLSERTGRTIRLPTEAEWEWAARGADGRIFPWGDNVRDDQSNTRAGGVGMVVPVGCYEHARTPWDHLDPGPIEMTGNVWEWCSSIVEKADGAQFGYPYSEHDGRENEEDIQHSLRATRGGHYDADLLVARCAYRGRDVGSVRLARQGFRPVRDVDDPPAEARL